MSQLPPCWAAYARLQHQLRSRSNIDDRVWGLDGALNAILESDFQPNDDGERSLKRAHAAASRRHRYYVAHFHGAQNDDSIEDHPNAVDVFEQVSSLLYLEAVELDLRNPEDRRLVASIAAGEDYADLASKLDQTEANLRSRMCRLRARLRQLPL